MSDMEQQDDRAPKPVAAERVGPGSGNLILKGEEIVFPVPDDHPLAALQEVREVDSLDDVENFEFVQQWRRLKACMERDECGAEAPLPQSGMFAHGVLSESMMLSYAKQLGSKLQLKLADFIVPSGTTVVLSNALNEITANDVKIAGLLQATGNLTITCHELRGGSGCVDVIPPADGAPGTDSGGLPAPAAPGTAAAGSGGGLFSGPTAGAAGAPGIPGANGGTGGPGANGGTFSAIVEVLGPDLCVKVSGGNGGRGGNGQSGGLGGKGGTGGSGFATGGGAAGGTGGTGGTGGSGGNGGTGGNGGRISINFRSDASAGTSVLTANGGAGGPAGVGAAGGSGGPGGDGGAGGAFSFGATGASGPAGAAGARGTDGFSGANGQPGTVAFVQRP